MKQKEVSKDLKEGVLGKGLLQNGDESVIETTRQETLEQETLEQEILEQKILEQKTLEQETLAQKVSIPLKTTGSVGNFGKHVEMSNEVGCLGERLGRLASTKGEHHYFQ